MQNLSMTQKKTKQFGVQFKTKRIMAQREIKIELPQEVIDELVALGVLTEEED